MASPIDDQYTLTVDEVNQVINEEAFTVDELRAIREHEQDRDVESGPRSTLIEDLDGYIDEATAGPDIPQSRVEPGVVDDDLEPGELPSPYSDAAPETIRITTPTALTFAGHFLEDGAGDYQIPYSMRVKRQLERDTNRVQLSRDDPLHPDYEPESGDGIAGDPVF